LPCFVHLITPGEYENGGVDNGSFLLKKLVNGDDWLGSFKLFQAQRSLPLLNPLDLFDYDCVVMNSCPKYKWDWEDEGDEEK